MDDGLADPPHHGVDGEHAEAAVLVNEGDDGRGHEAEGAGDDGPHQQDHHAVELAQLVPSQHGEGDQGGDTVQEDGGHKAPHKYCNPEISTIKRKENERGGKATQTYRNPGMLKPGIPS